MIVICEDVFVFFCFFSFINDWFNEEVFIFWIYLGGISGGILLGEVKNLVVIFGI